MLFRENATVDDFIDVIEGNRKYIKCVYVYNKIDVVGIDDVDRLSRQPNSIVISCNLKVSFVTSSLFRPARIENAKKPICCCSRFPFSFRV